MGGYLSLDFGKFIFELFLDYMIYFYIFVFVY